MHTAPGRPRSRTGAMSKLERSLNLSSEDVDIVALTLLYKIFPVKYFGNAVYFAPEGPTPEASSSRIDLVAPIFFALKLRETNELLSTRTTDPDEILRRLTAITGEHEPYVRFVARSILSQAIMNRDRGLVLYEYTSTRVNIRVHGKALTGYSPCSRRIRFPSIYPE